MCQLNSSSTLQELLECCSDNSSPCWEWGWREFLKRYKGFIYSKVAQRCASWGNPRIRKQLSDFVNEVVDAILANLYKNDCQALRNFSAGDNERMFLGWLGTICERTANRHIKALVRDRLIEAGEAEVRGSLSGLETCARWELYEMIVAELREFARRETENIERNIHLFQLHTWADFSEAMMQEHPFLKNIGHRTVDNLVTRMRKFLRQRRNLLE